MGERPLPKKKIKTYGKYIYRVNIGIPMFRYKAVLAQSVERKPFKLVAVGSSPTYGNIRIFLYYTYIHEI